MIKFVVTNENWQHIKGHCLYRVLFTWEGFETKTKVLWVQFCWSFKKMHAYIVAIQMIREPLYKAENNNNSNFLNVTKCQEVIYMLLINRHNNQVKYASLASHEVQKVIWHPQVHMTNIYQNKDSNTALFGSNPHISLPPWYWGK